jgi:hypothetical protein
MMVRIRCSFDPPTTRRRLQRRQAKSRHTAPCWGQSSPSNWANVAIHGGSAEKTTFRVVTQFRSFSYRRQAAFIVSEGYLETGNSTEFLSRFRTIATVLDAGLASQPGSSRSPASCKTCNVNKGAICHTCRSSLSGERLLPSLGVPNPRVQRVLRLSIGADGLR